MTGKQNEYPAPGTAGPRKRADDPLSRRVFLNTASCAAMGGLAIVAGGSLLIDQKVMATTTAEAPPLPWKYAKLDPIEAGKRGYKNYLLRGG